MQLLKQIWRVLELGSFCLDLASSSSSTLNSSKLFRDCEEPAPLAGWVYSGID